MSTTVVLILLRLFSEILKVYSYVMLAQAVMSWFVRPGSALYKIYMVLRAITEPFVGLFRPLANKLTSRMGIPLDLAFLFAVLALQLVAGLVGTVHQYVWYAGLRG